MNLTYSKAIKTFIGAISCVFGLSAYAVDISQFKVNVSRDEKVLKIQLEEKEAHANKCDLIVTRFEYFADLSLISLDTKESDFCPTDVIGVRKAVVLWQLPLRMRSGGTLDLRVNGKILSKITWSNNN